VVAARSGARLVRLPPSKQRLLSTPLGEPRGVSRLQAQILVLHTPNQAIRSFACFPVTRNLIFKKTTNPVFYSGAWLGASRAASGRIRPQPSPGHVLGQGGRAGQRAASLFRRKPLIWEHGRWGVGVCHRFSSRRERCQCLLLSQKLTACAGAADTGCISFPSGYFFNLKCLL